MEVLLECLPELQFISSLSEKEVDKYIRTAHPRVINCLWEITLNLVYSKEIPNGLKVGPLHVKRLSKYKRPLKALIKARNTRQRKKLLRGGVVIQLLSVLAGVIATIASLL
jgi:hypothetical protein